MVDYETWGKAFHDQMTQVMVSAELEFVEHDEDAEHNEAVGKAMWKFRHGDPDAAADFYNGWANDHGYPGVRIISRQPLQVDIGLIIPGGMIADFCSGEVRILSCGEWVRPGFCRLPASPSVPASSWGTIVPEIAAYGLGGTK